MPNETEPPEIETLKPFTVIGMYDNGQRYADHFLAESPDDAAMLCAKQLVGGNLAIVAIIAGRHMDLLEGDYVHDTDDLLEITETEE